MEKSFWKSKPLIIDENLKEFTQILSNEDILYKVNYQINSSKLKLDYKLYSFEKQKSECKLLTNKKINEILLFINNNYISGHDDFKYIYTFDLLNIYCRDSIILEFYPKKNTKVVGYIIGKRTTLTYFDKCSEFLEVNFLCLTYNLRNLRLAPFIINCLTKESIINYGLSAGHCTINSDIKSPYFSKKNFYHRMINIDNLTENGFINYDINSKDLHVLKKVYNSFSYKINSNKNKCVILINDNNKDLYKYRIHEGYKEYSKRTYDIYLDTNLEDIYCILSNKSFYNFVIVDSCDYLKGFISFFKLDTNTKKGIYSNGFYYKMFFSDNLDDYNIIDYLELVNEYIYRNNIFDVITFADHFDINYEKMNCIKGGGELKYYLFNYNFTKVDNHRNGLITI